MSKDYLDIIDPIINLLARDGESLDLYNPEYEIPSLNEEEFIPVLIDWDAFFKNDWDINDSEFLSQIMEVINRKADIEDRFTIDNGSIPWPEDIDLKKSIWETAAWYQPIHYFGYDWGIYIREDCLKTQALKIAYQRHPIMPPGWPAYNYTRLSPQDLAKIFLRASFNCFFLHEHFHHKVESFAIRLHVATDRAIYNPYHTHIYKKHFLTKDCLEEALANADSYNRLTESPYKNSYPGHDPGRTMNKEILKKTQEYLDLAFKNSPDGYNQAGLYLKNDFDKGARLLQSQIKEANLTPRQITDDWIAAPNMLRSLFSIKSNIYTVVKKGQSSLLPFVQPQSYSTADMIDAYRKAGYQVEKGKGKGSHIKLSKSGRQTMIVPSNRKDLSPGVISNALRILRIQA